MPAFPPTTRQALPSFGGVGGGYHYEPIQTTDRARD